MFLVILLDPSSKIWLRDFWLKGLFSCVGIEISVIWDLSEAEEEEEESKTENGWKSSDLGEID